MSSGGVGVKVAARRPLQPAATDWERCCLCQSHDKKALECPAKCAVASRRNIGYVTVGSKLQQLIPFNYKLPSGRGLDSLDEGQGIIETLKVREAVWHKHCQESFRVKTKFNAILTKAMSQSVAAASTGGYSEAPKTSSPDQTQSLSKPTRSSAGFPATKTNICFLCKKQDKPEFLHNCQTKGIHARIEECAKLINDFDLLGFLSQGDVMALEAKYHLVCLNRLYNRGRRVQYKESGKDEGVVICEGIAFADLCAYVHSKLESNCVFKLIDLKKMYIDRLAQLLSVSSSDLPYTHTTRFSEKLLGRFPMLESRREGRNIMLRHVGSNILPNIPKEDQDDDALGFNNFAASLRREIAAAQTSFEGTFGADCQERSVPPGLLAAVNTLLYGKATGNPTRATKPALTICQLFILNHQQSMPLGQIVRHKKTHEPPLPLYMALKVHGTSRNFSLIQELHHLGVSISPNRVMEITSDLCHIVVKRAEEEKILCPPNLALEVFTMVVMDNIDHNPRSMTAEGSFHGTSVSVFQIPTVQSPGHRRHFETTYASVMGQGKRSVPDLPESYSIVPEYFLASKTPSYSRSLPDSLCKMTKLVPVQNLIFNEKDWFESVQQKLQFPTYDELDVTWAAFHASKETPQLDPKATDALLPLFHEQSQDPAMVQHTMHLTSELAKYLNQGQTPVLVADQPIYAIAKKIQWNSPEKFDEGKFFVYFAPFHIEQAFLRVIGNLAEDSGWKGIVANSGIITEGSAEGILKVTHVTRARFVYQITAAVLYQLLYNAYSDAEQEGIISFEQWIEECCEKSPTFLFWTIFLSLIVLLLSFVRSVRQGNFKLFSDSLRQMMPWFFFFNHTNYARWLTVFIKDLTKLPLTAPRLYKEFKAGKFIIRKTSNPFSGLAPDQAHEQNNALVKEEGGAIGLTQDPGSLRRWMLGGPELSRLLREFNTDKLQQSTAHLKHHEQYVSHQNSFVNKCTALMNEFLTCGNPFKEMHTELIAVDTRVVVASIGVTTLRNAESHGKQQYLSFIEDRLISSRKSIFDTLPKNQCKIFSAKTKKTVGREKMRDLQLDLQLFSRLFIVCLSRNLNLDDFFTYENQASPPSLSLHGKLRSGDKSELLKILEGLYKCSKVTEKFDGIVFDGACIVRFATPHSGGTFNDYFNQDFIPYILRQGCQYAVKRIDIVWDLYFADSLKSTTRESRGLGILQQVTPGGPVPKNWNDFLSCSENKERLFAFLGSQFLYNSMPYDRVTNIREEIDSSPGAATSLRGLDCSSAEEADSRIVLHVHDMVQHGCKSILIRTVDTDVVVLAVSYYFSLQSKGLDELWVSFGTGKNHRFVAIHLIAEALGVAKSCALRGFHSFTGTDTTSFFAFRGKKSAWNTWMQFPEVTSAFQAISNPLDSISEEVYKLLERFTVLLYDKHCISTSVNAARKTLFATSNRPLNLIPPTAEALRQHSLRAAFQSGHVWGNATSIQDRAPSPVSWGWARNQTQNKYIPVWTTLPEVWAACRELSKCTCKTGCLTNRCPCRRADLPCTLWCAHKNPCGNTSDKYGAAAECTAPSSGYDQDIDDPSAQSN